MKTPLLGKIMNPPNESRIDPRHIGTISQVRAINFVAVHLSRNGWNVIFERGGDEGVVPALRNVTIDSKKTKTSQLNAILHEAGHASLFSDPEYPKKYYDGYIRLSNKKNTRSLRHKVDVLREEIAAWDEAEKIAASLGIDVDIQCLRDDRNRCLKTYIEWVNG
jgi:hypothetical protein